MAEKREANGVSFKVFESGKGTTVAQQAGNALLDARSKQREEAQPLVDGALAIASAVGAQFGDRARTTFEATGHFDDEGGNLTIKVRVFTDSKHVPFLKPAASEREKFTGTPIPRENPPADGNTP